MLAERNISVWQRSDHLKVVGKDGLSIKQYEENLVTNWIVK